MINFAFIVLLAVTYYLGLSDLLTVLCAVLWIIGTIGIIGALMSEPREAMKAALLAAHGDNLTRHRLLDGAIDLVIIALLTANGAYITVGFWLFATLIMQSLMREAANEG